MDHFPDGNHVRLRSRERGLFLHADEDGVGVSLSRRGTSLNTAWQARRVARGNATYLLLRGAAYGRYLALSLQQAPIVYRVVQVVYDAPNMEDCRVCDWEAVRASNRDEDVVLRQVSYDRLLRVHGGYSVWRTSISVDHYRSRRLRSRSMNWVVEAIATPARTATPAFPGLIPTCPKRFLSRLFYQCIELLHQSTMFRRVQEVLQDDYSRQEHETVSPQPEFEMGSLKDVASNADDISSTPPDDSTEKARRPQNIQQEGVQYSVSAAGAALGEHPSVGINTAEQLYQDADFAWRNAKMEADRAEMKYEDLRQQMQDIHQKLDNEGKKMMQKKIKALKNERDKKKNHASELEQVVYNARDQYHREVLRLPQND